MKKVCSRCNQPRQQRSYFGNTTVCIMCTREAEKQEKKQKREKEFLDKMNRMKNAGRKVCPTCKSKRSFSQYYYFNKYGVPHGICKKCHSRTTGNWARNNKEKYAAIQKEYRKQNPDRAREWFRKSQQKMRDELHPCYLRALLRNKGIKILKSNEDENKELIHLQKMSVSARRRLLKKCQEIS